MRPRLLSPLPPLTPGEQAWVDMTMALGHAGCLRQPAAPNSIAPTATASAPKSAADFVTFTPLGGE